MRVKVLIYCTHCYKIHTPFLRVNEVTAIGNFKEYIIDLDWIESVLDYITAFVTQWPAAIQ